MLSSNFIDAITHWPTSYGGRGEQNYFAPRQVQGKWEDSSELFTDDNGKERMSKAVVYLDSDVSEDDWLYLGETNNAVPTQTSGARRVAKFEKVRSLSGSDYERTAYLV